MNKDFNAFLQKKPNQNVIFCKKESYGKEDNFTTGLDALFKCQTDYETRTVIGLLWLCF